MLIQTFCVQKWHIIIALGYHHKFSMGGEMNVLKLYLGGII